MIQIIIVDDQKVVTQGLKLLLEAEADIQVLALGANGKDAIALVSEHQPDVLLIDHHMPIMDGIEATRHILAEFPNQAILLLSASDDDDCIRNAMLAGAKGYLLKSTSGEDLARSIRAAHRGYSQMSPGLMEKLIAAPPASSSHSETLKDSQRADKLSHLLQHPSQLDPNAIAQFLDTIPNQQTAADSAQQLKATLQQQPDHLSALYLTGSLVQKFQPHSQQALALFQKAFEQSQRQNISHRIQLHICQRIWTIDPQMGFKGLSELMLSPLNPSPQIFFQDLAQVFGQKSLAYRQLMAFWQIQILKDLCNKTDTIQAKLFQLNNQWMPKVMVSHSLYQ